MTQLSSLDARTCKRKCKVPGKHSGSSYHRVSEVPSAISFDDSSLELETDCDTGGDAAADGPGREGAAEPFAAR